jgi:hypothetical protein
VQNSRGETINQVLDAALSSTARVGSGSPLSDPLATASLFRAARQPGMVLPTVSAFTGRFMTNGGLTAATSTSTQFITPTGLTINVTPSVNATTGVVTFTIVSITQVVTTPTGGSVVVQLTDPLLVGATLTETATSGETSNISIVPQGQTTPLTDAQAQASVQTAVTTAVTTGIGNGSLPAGTQTPSDSPTSTGKFSGSGS